MVRLRGTHDSLKGPGRLPSFEPPLAVARRRSLPPLRSGGAADAIGGESSFPLAPDHRLLIVLSHNMARAFLHNKEILLTLPRLAFSPQLCGGDAGHVRTFRVPRAAEDWPDTPQDCGRRYGVRIPTSLSPTALQGRVTHYPWIDVLPCPALRDNVIAACASGRVDMRELLLDMVGDAFGDLDRWVASRPEGIEVPGGRATAHTELRRWSDRPVSQGPGLVSWSDPWETAGWEFTEAFARKWRALLVGCDGFLASTNRWRLIRGERALEV